jgi:TPR repeat protein
MNDKLNEYSAKGSEYLEKKEFKKALRCLLKAENIQEGYDALNIGNIYDGYSLCQARKNRKKAIKWFKKATNTGSYNGMSNLAAMYREAYKFKKAIKWLKKAIKYGDNEAAYELAKLYLMEGKIQKSIKLLEIFKGDRLKLNISEGGQEDALKLLNKIRKSIKV